MQKPRPEHPEIWGFDMVTSSDAKAAKQNIQKGFEVREGSDYYLRCLNFWCNHKTAALNKGRVWLPNSIEFTDV